MSKYLIYSLLFLVVTSTPASSQDLNTLRERASQLWAERLQANKSKAAEFIEKEARSDFPMYENVREATVTTLEFTQDKSKIRVMTKAKAFVPTIGAVDQTVIESWVWKTDEAGGNWFVHAEPALNPFDLGGAKSATTVRQGFTFQLTSKKIDLGAHKQGDTIKGMVKFAAPRAQLQTIRARGMGGFLRVGTTRWIDDKNGEFDFTIDSSLISQDFNENVVVEGVGPEKVFEVSTIADTLTVVGRVEGKFRITQIPQTPEAEKDRFVELEIRNLSNASFRVERIRPVAPNFVVLDALTPLPLALAPGQSARIRVSNPTEASLADGELMIQLSVGVLPSNSVLFRIKGLASLRAEQQPASPPQSPVDAAVRQALQDAERRRVPQ